MKVCVLQPLYEGDSLAHGTFDPARDLSDLLPGDQVVHVSLRKSTVYKQLFALKRQRFDIFVNLCDGYLDWETPSIDVIHCLQTLDLPFTGPTPGLYDPAVREMKLAAFYAGVASPRWCVAHTVDEVDSAAAALRFPLFVKPNHGGDSRGIDAASLCETPEALQAKAAAATAEFDGIVIEEFVSGREFSVLVLADPDNASEPVAFLPVEFLFPDHASFKTYDLKLREHHPDRNIPCRDPDLGARLQRAARDIFLCFGGIGACRMDFRLDAQGAPNLLDVNFAFSVFYPPGSEGTADYILRHDERGPAWFLRELIREGLARYRATRKGYAVTGDSLNGYGIRATRPFRCGEIIFRGENAFHRLVTRRHATRRWPARELGWLKQYGVPVSEHVFITWDDRPEKWAPQNHSCNANTTFVGLDVCATRDIAAGEELTLDYAAFMGADMDPFACACGSPGCRGVIRGTPCNSVDARERAGA